MAQRPPDQGRLLIRVAGTGFPAFPGICPASARAWQNYPVRFTDRLNQPQKIVVVVAFGIALATAGNYFLSLGNFGWYAYAPLSQSVSSLHTGLAGWLRLIIWLVLICLWALVSLWVLRPSPERSARH